MRIQQLNNIYQNKNQRKTILNPLQESDILFYNNYRSSFEGKKDYTENEKKFFNFKTALSRKFHKLDKNLNLARWNFYTNSSDENEKIHNIAFEDYLKTSASPEILDELSTFDKKGVSDKNLKESLADLLTDYKNSVTNAKAIQALEDKENEIAKKINTCRGEIDGKPVSNSEIAKRLEDEKNIELRKKLYYESKVKGPDLIADDLIELVKMRNEYAKKNGYDNYYSYQLKDSYKVDEVKLFKLLDDLINNTSRFYDKLATKDQNLLAKTYGISTAELELYHYGLVLADSPKREADKYIKNNDAMVETSLKMYKRMGWDISKSPILLDLFPRENKNQHGFCFGIDTNKDVRIMANLRNDIVSAETLNHELGHAVYDIGISERLPYFKREYPTYAITEAVAMHMQSLPYRENTFVKDLKIPPKLAQKLEKERCKDLVQFVRKYVFFANFEKELYANPNQDIKKLWYELESKYLKRKMPKVLDNRWASVPHFLSHPAYLQNYLRAEVMAAQIYEAATEKLGALTENKDTAEFFRKKMFRVGTTLSEDELIKKLTGKGLNAAAFLRQLEKLAK